MIHPYIDLKRVHDQDVNVIDQKETKTWKYDDLLSYYNNSKEAVLQHVEYEYWKKAILNFQIDMIPIKDQDIYYASRKPKSYISIEDNQEMITVKFSWKLHVDNYRWLGYNETTSAIEPVALADIKNWEYTRM